MLLDIRARDYRRNPYPYFKQLRESAPVCRTHPHGHWAISRHADVHMVLKNSTLFSSADINPEPSADDPQFLLFSRGLIGKDKPDHTRLRRLISKAFTPHILRQLELKIRVLCQTLVKNLDSNHTIDFMHAFAMPLPIIVIAELLGIDPEKRNDFKRWADMLISWRSQEGRYNVKHEVANMFQYFTTIIAERKKNPQADIISALVAASENEELTNSEVLGFVRLLLVAGTETTTNLLGNAMLALLAHPEQMQQLQQDPTKIPNFIEEALRYDGPALSLIRRVTDDVEMAGITLRKNEFVLPLLASANHDETIFAAPEKFDIHRNTQAHLAFGTGIHYCLGSMLARLQARTAFEEIFSHFQAIEHIQDEPLIYLESFFFRGVQSLELRFI